MKRFDVFRALNLPEKKKPELPQESDIGRKQQKIILMGNCRQSNAFLIKRINFLARKISIMNSFHLK